MTEEQIKENIDRIHEELADAERKAGREAGAVKLCAVSKFHAAADVVAAIKAGQLLFGENRVQEACSKFTEIGGMPLQCVPELHIIGTLQLNKVKKAVEVASCIQSVDREELLAEMEKRCASLGKDIRVLFELHTGEESKAGYADEKALYASLENCAKGCYPHVIPSGLMTMAPFTEDESLVRKSFSTLRQLREKLSKDFPSLRLDELSMGMSGDYRIAVEEGSTMVRIGTAIFGPRTI
ncbi:MAG: YggS family pyridoxal phosphate-dependent enzyme [Treponema sp.]|nr:YggS family pyridoxal phosphate-dependent enzyme [Treponema sp.]